MSAHSGVIFLLLYSEVHSEVLRSTGQVHMRGR